MFLCALLRLAVKGLPVHTPLVVAVAALVVAVAALVVALAADLASGVLPAQRAASRDPVEAVRAE
ncbi:MAG: hypothetical protein LAO05_16695 [Acidobacteriia bacterium]|nr:hypothetical protein [Terriglobia bacterium]